MGRGGKRQNSGRPKGAKDAIPRTTKKKLTTTQRSDKKEVVKYEENKQSLYLHIKKYLSTKNRKIYKELMPHFETELDCLEALRDDAMTRYNFARVAELEGTAVAKRIAKDAIEEIEKNGTLDGKALIPSEQQIKLKRYKTQLKSSYPKLSSQVTTLMTELRQLNEVISNIRSGRQDLTMNIFNILQSGDKKEVKELGKRLFTLPAEAADAEDAEWMESENKKSKEETG